MSMSMAILREGYHPKQWQVTLADSVLPADSSIYQQGGIGNTPCVVHACRNLGGSFDSASHRAADAALSSAEGIKTKPRTTAEKDHAKKLVRNAWESAKYTDR